MKKCSCGSGNNAVWIYDARGIPLAKVCGDCKQTKLSKFRPEILVDPSYETDEQIEPLE